MNIAVFLMAVVVQITFTLWLSSLYFRAKSGIRQKQGAQFRLAEYVLFLVFVLTVIPICMYFPAWLGEELEAFSPTAKSRIFLLALGGVGLMVSIIGGRKRV